MSRADIRLPRQAPQAAVQPYAGTPVCYHHHAERDFIPSAESCGCVPGELREAVERAIRTRGSETFLDHPADAGNGSRPDVLTLRVGGSRDVRVHFTVEQFGVFVRGFSWTPNGPDEDAGGYYPDAAISRD